MKNYNLLIFDLDGTLIDSIQDYTTATNRLLAENGRDPVSVETVTYYIGHGLQKYICDLFPEESATEEGVQQVAQRFFQHYDDVCLDSTYLYHGVPEILDMWPGKKAIVTNKSEAFAKKIVNHLLPNTDFLAVFGADTFENKKPHPQPILETLKLANASAEETLMIGDSAPDLLSSQAAGVENVLVTYGYAQKEKLTQHNPTHIIDCFSELAPIVTSTFSSPFAPRDERTHFRGLRDHLELEKRDVAGAKNSR